MFYSFPHSSITSKSSATQNKNKIGCRTLHAWYIGLVSFGFTLGLTSSGQKTLKIFSINAQFYVKHASIKDVMIDLSIILLLSLWMIISHFAGFLHLVSHTSSEVICWNAAAEPAPAANKPALPTSTVPIPAAPTDNQNIQILPTVR